MGMLLMIGGPSLANQGLQQLRCSGVSGVARKFPVCALGGGHQG